MAAIEVKSVKLTLAFQDAETRTYTFNDVDESLSPADVKDRVKAINTNMPEAFAVTFVSSTGARCVIIREAKVIWKREEVIYSAS